MSERMAFAFLNRMGNAGKLKARDPHSSWQGSGSEVLPWIFAFKAFKPAPLPVLGVILLATRQADPVDLLMRLALTVHLPLTSALFERALTLTTGLTPSRHIGLAITAFGYAALMGTEGLALYLRR